MKRTLLIGASLCVLGCWDGPDDGANPETSGMDLQTTQEAAEVDPRGDWGSSAPAAVLTARTAPINLRELQVREEQAVTVNVSSAFDPENVKSIEAFRMRTGVQR